MKKDNGLIKAINDAINHTIENGTYQQILERWNITNEAVDTSLINRPAFRRPSELSSMSEILDVIVIGGGLVGSSAAWRLAARGRSVVQLEQFGPGHKHGASHGTSRIYRQAYDNHLYTGLAADALPLWRELETTTDIGSWNSPVRRSRPAAGRAVQGEDTSRGGHQG